LVSSICISGAFDRACTQPDRGASSQCKDTRSSEAYRPMSDQNKFSPPQLARNRPLLLIAGGVTAAFLLSGCASQKPQSEGVWRNVNTNEFFSQDRYGQASPRVVANGRPVPRGGGRRVVGRPYTIAGQRFRPREFSPGQTQVGRASWYGSAFHGRKTANGEIYDMSSVTAAHPTMPLPSYVRVTNLDNNRSLIVRVNDRGPFHGGRVIDMSKRSADLLAFRNQGTARVRVQYLRPASTEGSDDRILIASLRTDGSPAQMDGGGTRPGTMLASVFSRGTSAAAGSNAGAAAGRNVQPAPTQAAAAPTPPPQRPAAAPMEAGGVTQVAAADIQLPDRAPMPAARPFDLVGSSAQGARGPAPSRRPANLARAQFYAPFSPEAPFATRLHQRGQGPFGTLDMTGLQSLGRTP